MSVVEGQWVKGCSGTGKGQERGGEGEDRKDWGGRRDGNGRAAIHS